MATDRPLENDREPCPKCGSTHVAICRYGLPNDIEALEPDLDAGRIRLCGCSLFDDSPQFHCNSCGFEWGISENVAICREFNHKRDQADAHYRQGQEFATTGDPERAVEEYTRAIDLDAYHLKAVFGRGLALYRMGKAEAALSDLDSVIEHAQTWAEAYYSRALAHAALDHDAEALADYNAAIQWKPDYIDAFCGRAVVLKKLGRMEAALDDLNHVLTSDPSYSEALHTRATIHYFLGDWQRAVDDFTAFLRSPLHQQQHDFGALLLRGLAFHRLEKSELAVADLSRAIELRPDDGTTYIRRWEVYKAMGETAKAEADWAKGRVLMGKGKAARD